MPGAFYPSLQRQQAAHYSLARQTSSEGVDLKGLHGLIAVAFAMTASCGGSADPTKPGDGGPQATGANFMTATIDGVSFTATSFSVTGDSSVRFVSGSVVGGGAGQTIQLVIRDAVAGPLVLAAPYSTSGTQTSGWLFAYPDYWITDADQTGTLTVTTLAADHIAGTFQFDATGGTPQTSPQVRHVTNGKLDIRF